MQQSAQWQESAFNELDEQSVTWPDSSFPERSRSAFQGFPVHTALSFLQFRSQPAEVALDATSDSLASFRAQNVPFGTYAATGSEKGGGGDAGNELSRKECHHGVWLTRHAAVLGECQLAMTMNAGPLEQPVHTLRRIFPAETELLRDRQHKQILLPEFCPEYLLHLYCTLRRRNA